MAKAKKNKGGRPRVAVVYAPATKATPTIDAPMVEALASIGATHDEIAAHFRITRQTLSNVLKREPRLAELLERGAQSEKLSIRRRLHSHSQLKNGAGVKACEILAMFRLGWTPKHAIDLATPKGQAVRHVIEAPSPIADLEQWARLAKLADEKTRSTTPPS